MLSYWQSRWAWTNAVYYGDPRHQGEDPLVFQEHRTLRHADGPATLAISKRRATPSRDPATTSSEFSCLTRSPPTRPARALPDAGAHRVSTARYQGARRRSPGAPHRQRSVPYPTAAAPQRGAGPLGRPRHERSSILETLRLPSASSVITLWCTHTWSRSRRSTRTGSVCRR